jgi:hypothetical protein
MALDYTKLAGTKAKGKRPQYFDDPAVDRVMAITMAVAGELAVARERVDTLERLLEEKGLLARDEIEHYTPTREQAEERGLWHKEYIARILRIVQQEYEALEEASKSGSENALDDMVKELASI